MWAVSLHSPRCFSGASASYPEALLWWCSAVNWLLGERINYLIIIIDCKCCNGKLRKGGDNEREAIQHPNKLCLWQQVMTKTLDGMHCILWVTHEVDNRVCKEIVKSYLCGLCWGRAATRSSKGKAWVVIVAKREEVSSLYIRMHASSPDQRPVDFLSQRRSCIRYSTLGSMFKEWNASGWHHSSTHGKALNFQEVKMYYA